MIGAETVRTIAVVIPFYQRTPGILTRALDSILAQDLPPGLRVNVHIIDDASPASAEGEVAALAPPGAITMRVSRQPNSGPGSARNRALDLAERDAADFVAFLDSDDIWLPNHLRDAVQALDQGYDFYCCDNSREGAFERFSQDVPLLNDGGKALAPRAVMLEKGPVLGFPAHALDDEFVTGYLSHTSTVVLRRSRLNGLQFDPDLRSASEDRMFWLSYVVTGAPVVISWRCNVVCGKGVNIFFAAHDWNAPATLERIGCQFLFALKLLRMPGMTPVRTEFAKDRARTKRRAYSFLFLRTLLRGRRPPTASLRRLLRHDPLLPLRMPVLFLSVLVDRRPEARQF